MAVKQLERSALVRYSAQQMFDLVNDVESYPQFMDGCVEARVLSRSEDSMVARLALQKLGIKQAFVTENRWVPAERIDLVLREGPFAHFSGHWQFLPLQAQACKVVFVLEYAFSSNLLGLAAAPWMEAVATEQVDAVCRRAKVLYG